MTAVAVPLSTKITTCAGAVSHGDAIVTEADLDSSIRLSIKKSLAANQLNIDSIILRYKLDGVETVSEPIGMQGKKLEVEAMLFNYASQNIDAIEDLIDQIDVSAVEFFPSIISSSIVSLSTVDRKVGCVLIDIGADATSFVVYEQDAPVYVGFVPLGSDSITQSIALDYQISVQEAEIIKQGGPVPNNISSDKVAKTVKKAALDIFKAINVELKSINKSANLPGGAVLCGGGAMMEGMDTFARESLKIPARKASIRAFKRTETDDRELAWAGVYGLAIHAMEQERYRGRNHFGRIAKKLWASATRFFV